MFASRIETVKGRLYRIQEAFEFIDADHLLRQFAQYLNGQQTIDMELVGNTIQSDRGILASDILGAYSWNQKYFCLLFGVEYELYLYVDDRCSDCSHPNAKNIYHRDIDSYLEMNIEYSIKIMNIDEWTADVMIETNSQAKRLCHV